MDGHAVDEFHHEERLALAGDAPVEQSSDPGMVETGENLALHPEPLTEQLGGERQIDELDGDLLLKIAVGSMGYVDGAHAAPADEPVDFIGPDTLSFEAGVRIRACLPEAGGREQFF